MSLDDPQKQERLQALRKEVAQLEQELGANAPAVWQPEPTDYYGMYHATSGLVLGIAGALASLLFNVIGSLVVGQHPLKLIQVYLTFPLGEQALAPEFNTGITLAVGCCLYVGTGMLLGIPFQMAFARFTPQADLRTRLILGTLLGLVLWAVNFYLILSVVQPMLFGGNWIVETVSPAVGSATHLVFAWTMAALYPWGRHQSYRPPSAQHAT